MSDISEERIKKAKAKREQIVTDLAKFNAKREAAEERLDLLRKKAEANGLDVENLGAILEEKTSAFETYLTEFETALNAIEKSLLPFKDQGF